jgi:hypothetical protein
VLVKTTSSCLIKVFHFILVVESRMYGYRPTLKIVVKAIPMALIYKQLIDFRMFLLFLFDIPQLKLKVNLFIISCCYVTFIKSLSQFYKSTILGSNHIKKILPI